MNVKKYLASILSGLLIVGSVSYSPSNDNYSKSRILIAEGADAEVDTSWYDSEETELHISTGLGLSGFSRLLKTGITFEGKTIFLDATVYVNSWNGEGEFLGTFEGNGNSIQGLSSYFVKSNKGTINNLTITSSGSICYTNFGMISNCISFSSISLVSTNQKNGVIDHCLSNRNISFTMEDYPNSSDSRGMARHVGAICISNYGTISKSGNNGNITVYAKFIAREKDILYEGGICGYNSGLITDSYNTGNIYNIADYYIDSNGRLSGTGCTKYVGGICGKADSGTIVNVYNLGGTSKTEYTNSDRYSTKYNAQKYGSLPFSVGGICGYITNNKSSISNAFNASSNPKINYGISSSGNIDNCYYLNTSADKGDSNNVSLGKTEANMKKDSFVLSLGDAFEYVPNDYPKLAWETERYNSSFEPKRLDLKEYGEKQAFTLKTTYSGEVTWISSDTNVATVEDGVVTAVGNGNTTIYAICGISKVSAGVSVKYDYYLDKTEVEIIEGKKENINLFSKATNAITDLITPAYKSSDNKIATVNEKGEITAISQGSCTITASFLDKSLTCNVTVKPDPDKAVIPETKLSSNTLSIEQGAKSNISVQNFSGTVTWVSDDTKIATVSKQSNGLSATVSGVGIGTVKIYAMLSTGQTLVCNVTVKQGTTTTTKLTTTTTKPTTTTTKKTTTTTKKTTTTTKKTTTTTKKTTTTTKKTTTTTKKTTTTTKRTTTTTKKITTTVKVTTTTQPISIGKTKITMKNGEQYAIPANRNDLTYKSNNNDIAIVSSKGIITAVGTGNAVISVIDSEWNVVQINVTVTTSAKQGLPGDSNMDNQVDLSDVVLIMQSLANPNKYGLSGSDKSHLTEQGAANADVEGGNGITANDALTIQQYLLKIIAKLPV